MKRFINNIILFLIIIIIFLLGINVIQSYYNGEAEHYALQYDEVKFKKNKANGIILGTSHATHSIRPSVLDDTGINFFNFSLNGSNPIFYFNWYKEFFQHEYPNPDYCIFSVDWFMFDNKYLWRHFEQDAEYLPSKTVFKLIRNPDKFDAKDLIINRFPVLKYRTKLKNTVRLYKGDKRFPLEDYDKGFIPYSIPFDSANFQMKILETKINYSQVESFLNMLREMKSSNIKMVFVMTPEYGIESKYYDRLESIKIIKKISQKYNIPFLNFNTIYRSSINEDITNFSDWGHMNSSGSELFSAYLTKEIKFIVNDENLMNLGNR